MCASRNFEGARLSDAQRARGRLPGLINIPSGQEFPEHERSLGKSSGCPRGLELAEDLE